MRAISSLAIIMLVGGCAGADTGGPGAATSSDARGAAAGAQATDFSARDAEGHSMRLSDHFGKRAVLLNFCATWCEPCVAEFPHLRRLYAQNKDRGFIILGVAMDGPETVANVPAFVRRNQLNYPVILDEDSHVAAIYNPKKSAPLSILIDKRGRVFKIREGYNPGDEEFLAEDVMKMLAIE